MATPMKVFIAELRAFDGRRDVVRAMRKQIRKPLPKVRQEIKRHAIAILPGRGGLGQWVAKSRITAVIRYASARSAGVRLKGGRDSLAGRSDMYRMDLGRTRHPAWGRRGPGQWSNQAVPAGWFSDPVRDSDEWRAEIDKAVDDAFDKIRRG